jgi:hypothetical protein
MPHTVTTHKVAVPAEEVRKSGLLKDRILIHHPDATTTAEMALLEEAARRWGQMTAAWVRIAVMSKSKPSGPCWWCKLRTVQTGN